ncbi:efflux RND transporter periplasmic adaptor subunit [Runella salmonicolor]|uniref:Efflux RND transporter periplasmic adaptor subunit n=1 Tax=Runella salmonicolor TaxID=2950278 RepID=A0ABT1FQG7_9BACT|nr:efflux RND transporter periplasmic adaptor subunit [Runella salmonicolor]MCP1382848.1 efflux RND transporter periplasmic adaptor subunit [Runella salmonicolor]
MSKPVKSILTVLVILIITGLAFYPRLKEYTSKKEEKGATAPTGGGPAAKGGAKGGGPAPINIMVIGNQRLEEKILSTGTIIANEEVDIRSEIAGRITSINFKEGDYVKKGTVLVRINDADLQAQLQKLQYQKKLAEVNEERQKKLLEKEAISQRDYDISLTNLNSMNADIQNLAAQIAKTVIRAPFDGTIGLRYVSEGSYLSPGTVAKIATLTNVNPAKIDFSVPAKYAANVAKGTAITFTTESGDEKFYGRVYAIEPKIDPNTRTLTLRATSPNNNRKLFPGSFARIEIILNTKANGILVPTEAVIPGLKGHSVFVVRNNKAEPVEVQIGTRGDKTIEINKGLNVGDTLITSGILQVKPGGPVDIKEAMVKQ